MIAKRTSHNPLSITPIAASSHTGSFRPVFQKPGIIDRTGGIKFSIVPVQDPFRNVSGHIMQTQLIGRETPDRLDPSTFRIVDRMEQEVR
jgi:hypothetical protein